MAYKSHTVPVGKKLVKFGADVAKRTISIPADITAHEFAQAVGTEYGDGDSTMNPLGRCFNGEGGRIIILAKGWKINPEDRHRILGADPSSEF
jgi:hypothetical protein